MIAALVLAQAAVVAPASGAEAAVPATAWSCRLVDAKGLVREISGTSPLLTRGRDPNHAELADITDAGSPRKGGITGSQGGEWLRDYQVDFSDGEGSLVLNLRLRKDSEGVAWLTRYDDALGAQRQPYRYVSAGLCSGNFAPSGISQ